MCGVTPRSLPVFLLIQLIYIILCYVASLVYSSWDEHDEYPITFFSIQFSIHKIHAQGVITHTGNSTDQGLNQSASIKQSEQSHVNKGQTKQTKALKKRLIHVVSPSPMSNRTSTKKSKQKASFLSALQQNLHQDLAFLSARLQDPQDPGASYHDLKGGIAHTHWRFSKHWGIDLGYLFAYERVYLVFRPTALATEADPMLDDQSSATYTYTYNTMINQNQASGSHDLGWHHIGSLALSYTTWNEGSQRVKEGQRSKEGQRKAQVQTQTQIQNSAPYGLRLVLGVTHHWKPNNKLIRFANPAFTSTPSSSNSATASEMNSPPKTLQAHFVHSAQHKPTVQPWGLIEWQHHWYWLKAQWGGVQADASAWSQLSTWAGVNLGRAHLGLGWAWGEQDLNPDHQGLTFLVQVPLSAAIHLHASAWIRQDPYDDRLITVGLRWTGEKSAPELDPPQSQQAPSSGRNEQLTPFDPVPLNPAQPQSNPTDRPLSPLNPTYPNQPSPSPNPL